MPGTLHVQLLRGHRLRDAAFFGVQDPFVLVKLGGNQKKSGVCRDGGVTPIWDETITFSMKDDDEKKITLVVRNKGLMRNDLIGTGEVDLTEALENGQHNLRVPLLTKGDRTRGEIELVLLYESTSNSVDDGDDLVPAKRDRAIELPADYVNRTKQGASANKLPAAYPAIYNPQEQADVSKYPAILPQVDYPCVPNNPPPRFPSGSMSSVEQSFNDFGIADEIQSQDHRQPQAFPLHQDIPAPINGQVAGYVGGFYPELAPSSQQHPYTGPPAVEVEQGSNPQPTTLQERFEALQPPAHYSPDYLGENAGTPLEGSDVFRDDEFIV